MTKDLTTGNPFRLIWGFALPTLLGILFQQCYSLIDTMIVGRLLDTSALSAVGSTGSLNFMVIGFVLGMSNGFAIPVAQRMGAGQHSLMRLYVSNAYYLTAIFSIGLTLLTTVFCRDILIAMKTPDDIFDRAYYYILVTFCGIPAIFLYNLLASIIRALGDSKTPVYFLGLSSVVNIALDYYFIAHTPLDVAGAALATVLAQGFSAVCCLGYLRKKFPMLKTTAEERRFDKIACRNLCYMGLPMGLQFSITATGNVILQSAVNGLGSTVVGAIATSTKVSIFFWAPFDALGATMATFCGQNVGALKLDRLKIGVRDACIMGLGYAFFANIFIHQYSHQILSLFLNGEEENVSQFLDYASHSMKLSSTFMPFLCVLIVTRFSIQGMGFSNFAMLAGVTEMVTRIVVANYGVPRWGFEAACYGSPLAWVAAICFLIPATGICINKLHKKHPQLEQSAVS